MCQVIISPQLSNSFKLNLFVIKQRCNKISKGKVCNSACMGHRSHSGVIVRIMDFVLVQVCRAIRTRMSVLPPSGLIYRAGPFYWKMVQVVQSIVMILREFTIFHIIEESIGALHVNLFRNCNFKD